MFLTPLHSHVKIPVTARTAGSCIPGGDRLRPPPFLLLYFPSPGSLPETWKSAGESGPNRWRKPYVILPFEEEGKGRCRGVLTFRHTAPARAGDGVSWATDATPAPFARHSGSHGQTGTELLEGSMTEKKWLFLCQRHIKIQQAAESPWPCNARFLSPPFGHRAVQSGSGLLPGAAPGV